MRYGKMKIPRFANYLAATLEGLSAFGAGEALLMIGVAHGGDDFAFDVVLANGTFGSESFLVVGDAVVVGVFRKEPADCQ